MLALVSLVMFVVVALVGAFVGAGRIGEGPVDAFILWQSLVQLLVFAVPVAVVVWRYYRGDVKRYCRFDLGGRKWLHALAGVAVLLLLVPAIDWLTVWNDAWHWSGALEQVEQVLREAGRQSQELVERMLREGNLWLCLFGMALVPAVCEELFFRAGVQNLLQRWFGNVHAAVWVTALVFSLAHGEVFAFLPRFALGGLLGYLYVGGGSIVVNMTVHFINNALVVVLSWLYCTGAYAVDPSSPLEIGWEVTLCCTLAAVGVMAVTFGKGLKTSR